MPQMYSEISVIPFPLHGREEGAFDEDMDVSTWKNLLEKSLH